MRSVRFATRQFRRSPFFFAVVVLTLGVGIGVSTTLFSVADAVLLRPLPFPGSGDLVRLWSVDMEEQSNQRVSYPDFVDWQSRSKTLDMAGYGGLESVLTGWGGR